MIVGERLTDEEVDSVIKFTDLQEDLDGNVKYEGKCMTLLKENILGDALEL